mgnify:CR=1 FL=1
MTFKLSGFKEYGLALHMRFLGYGFLLIALSLVYLAPYWWFQQPTTQAALVRVFLVVSVCCLIFEYWKGEEGRGIYFDRTHLVLFLLLFGYLLLNSLFLSENFKSVRRLFFVFILFLPFVFVDIKESFLEKVFLFFAVVVFLFALLSLAVNYYDNTLPLGYRKGGIYRSGVGQVADFGNTIVAGLYYSTGLLLAFYFYLTARNNLVFLLSVIMVAVIAAYVFLTFARTSWLVAGVGLIVLMLSTYERELRGRFYFVVFVLIALLSYYALTKLGYEVGVRGLTYRDQIWAESFLRIKESIAFGHGLLSETGWIYIDSPQKKVNNPHSLYLEILYQTGVVGLVLYLLFLLRSLWLFFVAVRRRVYGKTGALFLSALIGVSAGMTVDIIGWINSPNYVWLWLWVPMACSFAFIRGLKRENAISG